MFYPPELFRVERREHSVVKVHNQYIAQVFCLQHFRLRAARLSPWLKPGACAAQQERSVHGW